MSRKPKPPRKALHRGIPKPRPPDEAHTQDLLHQVGLRPDLPPPESDEKWAPTPPLVDVQTPTTTKSGRPQKTDVDAHKKDRHRAGRVRWHARIDPAIDLKVRYFLATHDLDLQEFIQIAAVHFIEGVDAHNEKKWTPYDDLMMIFKTKTSIIKLYFELTGNKWKPRDDQHGQRFNEMTEDAITIAMVETRLRAGMKKKINSFKYFVAELENWRHADLDPDSLRALAKMRRRSWEKAKQSP